MPVSAEDLGLLLADGRLPVGGHTQSAGATAAVARQFWCAHRTRSTGGSDHGLLDALVEVDRAWRARTASDAMRDASDLLGRGYLRLARRLWPVEELAGRTWCRAVVL